MKKLLLLAILMGALAGAAAAFNGSVSGYVTDNTEEDEFALLADSTNLDVNFIYPSGADFYVTVYGRSHNELGEFRLADGAAINLTGGGLFYLEIFSKDTGGDWSATWEDSD